MEEVRYGTLLAPLASPCFILSSPRLVTKSGTEGLFSLPGEVGNHFLTSIVWWNLRPVVFGVDILCLQSARQLLHYMNLLFRD